MSMSAVAFVTKNNDFFTNPTLTLLFNKLKGNDVKIIFIGDTADSSLSKEYVSHLICLEAPSPFLRWLRRPKILIRELAIFWRAVKACRIHKVKWLLAVDSSGLIVAHVLSRFLDTKLAYLSFEIAFEDEVRNASEARLLRLERSASLNVDLILTQDETRESMLISRLSFPEHCRRVRIPVSYSKMATEKQYDLHALYDIPSSCTIVVHSGSFANWTCADELLDSISEWPPGFWLIIHNRRAMNNEDALYRKVNSLISSGAPITLTHKPLSYTEYFNFLSGCDIGLTFYGQVRHLYTGRNIREVGLSSGKFSAYSMVGLPIVTSYSASFYTLNKRYDYGRVLNSFEDLPDALVDIRKNYETKRKGSMKMYYQELEPDAKIADLVSFLI